MNTIKKTLIGIFGSLLLTGTLLGSAACTQKDELYKVTATFDETKGVVTLSDSEKEGGYAKGEEVTVTVTANTGYEIDAVTVNSTEVELDAGEYIFAVEGDTVVAATFKEEEKAEITYPAAFLGTWKAAAAAAGAPSEITVTEHALTVKIGETQETPAVTADGDGYSFTAGGTAYRLSATDSKNALRLTASAETFYVKDGASAAFPETFYGNWKKGETVLAIDASGATLGTEKGVAIEASGNTVYVLFGGKLYRATYDATAKTVTLGDGKTDDVYAAETAPAPATLPETYRAVWEPLGESGHALTIAESGITLDGGAAEAVAEGSAYKISKDGKEYKIALTSDGLLLGLFENGGWNLYSKENATLPDLAAAGLENTAWEDAESGVEVTFDEAGKATFKDFGGEAAVRILTYDAAAQKATFLLREAWYAAEATEEALIVTDFDGETAYTFAPYAEKDLFTGDILGDWTGIDEAATKITISAKEIKIGETVITEITAELFTYGFTFEDAYCELSLLEDNILHFVKDNEHIFLKKDGATYADIKIAAMAGTYSYRQSKIVVSEEGAFTLDGTPMQIISYAESSGSALCGSKHYTLTFTEDSVTLAEPGSYSALKYTRRGDSVTSFPEEFRKTWKQFWSFNGSGSGDTAEITETTFSYKGQEYEVTEEADGYTFNIGAFAYTFGFVDAAKTVFYIKMPSGNLYLFSADGETPSAALPEAYRSTMWDGTFGRFIVSADGEFSLSGNTGAQTLSVIANDAPVSAEGAETIRSYFLYNQNLYVLNYQTADGASSLTFTQFGTSTANILTQVTSVSLPVSYQGTWVKGEEEITVDANGTLTFKGVAQSVIQALKKQYDYTFSYEGASYGLAVTYQDGEDYYVLELFTSDDSGEFYVKKNATLPTQPIPQSSYYGEWKSGEHTLTIDEEGKMTLDGGEASVYGWESNSGDSGVNFIAYAFVNGIYYDLQFSGNSIIFNSFVSFTFTKQGGQTTEAIFDDAVQGSWFKLDGKTVTEESLQITKSALTAGAADSKVQAQSIEKSADGKTYTFTLGENTCTLGSIVIREETNYLWIKTNGSYTYYVNSFVAGGYPSSVPFPSALRGIEMKSGEHTLAIDESGNGTLDEAEIILVDFTYGGSTFSPDTTRFTEFCFFAGELYYTATVGEEEITVTDLEGNALTFTAEQAPSVEIGRDYIDEWKLLSETGLAEEATLLIEKNSITLNGKAATGIAATEDGYTFEIEGTQYTIGLPFYQWASEVIWLKTGETVTWYGSSFLTEIENVFATSYFSTRYTGNGFTLAIDGEGKATLNGEAVILISKTNPMTGSGFSMTPDPTKFMTAVFLAGGNYYDATFDNDNGTIDLAYGTAEDSDITVTLTQEKEAIKIDRDYIDEWKLLSETGLAEEATLLIEQSSITLNGKTATGIAAAENGYTFEIEGTQYTIGLPFYQWAEGDVIWLKTGETVTWYGSSFLPEIENVFASSYFSTRYTGNGFTLAIDGEGKATLNGEAVILISKTNAMTGSGFSMTPDPTKFMTAVFLAGGNYYDATFDNDNGTIDLAYGTAENSDITVTLTQEKASVSMPAEFNGSWSQIGGSGKIEIENGKITVNGTECSAEAGEAGEYIIRGGSSDITVSLHAEAANILVAAENGEPVYYWNGTSNTVSDDGMLTNFYGTYYSTDGAHTVNVDTALGVNITFDGKSVTMFSFDADEFESTGKLSLWGLIGSSEDLANASFGKFLFALDPDDFSPGLTYGSIVFTNQAPVNNDFTAEYVGEWLLASDAIAAEATLSIQAGALTLNGEKATAITLGDGFYTFQIGAKEYTLRFVNEEDPNVLYLSAEGTDSFYVNAEYRNGNSFPASNAFQSNYYGKTWETEGHTLVFDAQGVAKLDGKDVILLSISDFVNSFSGEADHTIFMTASFVAGGTYYYAEYVKTSQGINLTDAKGETLRFTLHIEESGEEIFSEEYRGTWKPFIGTTASIVFSITKSSVTIGATTYTATTDSTVRSEGFLISDPSKPLAKPGLIYFLDDAHKLLCYVINNTNLSYYWILMKDGETLPTAQILAEYCNAYSNAAESTYGTLTLTESGATFENSTVDAFAGEWTVFGIYTKGDYPEFYLFNKTKNTYWQFTFSSETALTVAQIGGYMKYSFEKGAGQSGTVEKKFSDDFSDAWKGAWRILPAGNTYFEINAEENTLFFREAPSGDAKNIKTKAYYEAKTADGGTTYTYTEGTVTYTLKLSQDGKLLIRSYESNGATVYEFFAPCAALEDVELVSDFTISKLAYTTIFPDYVMSDYSAGKGAENRLLFACETEGQAAVYFDDPDYEPEEDEEYEFFAHWGDAVLHILTWNADTKSGTMYYDGREIWWAKFSFTGTSKDDFKLTITRYDETTYSFRWTQPQEAPKLNLGDEWQSDWVDSEGNTLSIEKTAVTYQRADDPVATDVSATVEVNEGSLKFTFSGKVYTVTILKDGFYLGVETDGATTVYKNDWGTFNASSYLQYGGQYVKNYTWTNDKEHTLTFSGFTMYLDGEQVKFTDKNTAKTAGDCKGVYYESIAVVGNTIVFTPYGGGEAIIFTLAA